MSRNVKWFSFSDETVTARFIWIIMRKCKSYCCYCIASFYYMGTVSLYFSEYNVIMPAWMNSVWIKLIPGHMRKRQSCCGWCDKDTQGSRVMAPCIIQHESSLRWVVSLFVPGEKDHGTHSLRGSVCHTAILDIWEKMKPLASALIQTLSLFSLYPNHYTILKKLGSRTNGITVCVSGCWKSLNEWMTV